eukprot:g28705.t1
MPSFPGGHAAENMPWPEGLRWREADGASWHQEETLGHLRKLNCGTTAVVLVLQWRVWLREPAPVDLPEDHISVRQLMAYLCQGTTTEEGLARAFAVLSPSTVVASNTLPLETAHRTIFSLGARPLPGSSSGDGRPPFPAVQKFSEELDSKYDGNTKATAAVGKTEAFELIKALSLGRRHRRAEESCARKSSRRDPIRPALRAALDQEMDALVSPALDKVRDTMQSREEEAGQPKCVPLKELVSQIQGLADVRRFVDEQLTVDLGTRIRSCHNTVKARARTPQLRAAKATASQPRGTSSSQGGRVAVPTRSLALAPFRSISHCR